MVEVVEDGEQVEQMEVVEEDIILMEMQVLHHLVMQWDF